MSRSPAPLVGRPVFHVVSGVLPLQVLCAVTLVVVVAPGPVRYGAVQPCVGANQVLQSVCRGGLSDAAELKCATYSGCITLVGLVGLVLTKVHADVGIHLAFSTQQTDPQGGLCDAGLAADTSSRGHRLNALTWYW